jgi:hypothetical protein
MRLETLFENAQETAGQPSISDLCDLAATGLTRMYDPEQQLFCNIFARRGAGMERLGCSRRYTLMTLLGLHRFELSGGSSPVPVSHVLRNLTRDTHWIDGAGDLGLLLWTCAEVLPEHLPEVYRQVRADEALVRFPDARQGYTMEVAWYLTGLVASCEAGHSDLPGLPEQLGAARRILENNCGSRGIYGHLSRNSGSSGYLRGRIGSFADQVYPTIAFARLARALHDHEAQEMAKLTAATICELQGTCGEWSWLYSARSGRVISGYPVYSVHQHGMGPMMLFAAGDASGCDFGTAIGKSLAWISGTNELRRNLIEPSLALVWRSVYLGPANHYADIAMRFVRLRDGAAAVQRKIRYECRPYELGWLLYALAGKSACSVRQVSG